MFLLKTIALIAFVVSVANFAEAVVGGSCECHYDKGVTVGPDLCGYSCNITADGTCKIIGLACNGGGGGSLCTKISAAVTCALSGNTNVCKENEGLSGLSCKIPLLGTNIAPIPIHLCK